MNNERFSEKSKQMMKECFELLTNKGQDYTNGDVDVLRNFKKTAVNVGLTPLQVWSVYFMKHIDAIQTYIQKGELKSEPIESRIQDAINYLLLFNALIEDVKEKK